MSGNTSMGGIIAQGSKVEKIQEVQCQDPAGQRQRNRITAEEEKLRQQKQVRKTSEDGTGLTIAAREERKRERGQGDEPQTSRKKSRKQRDSVARKPDGGRHIDIVV